MNKNVLLGGVLVLLLAAIFVPKILPEKKNYPEVLAVIDSAAVDYIHMEYQGDVITLEKSGESWMLREPLKFQADDGAVARLLQQLGDLRVIARTSDNKDYAQDSRYELSDDKARRVQIRQGAQVVLDARFGKASSDYSNGFARLEGEEPVYRTAVQLASRFQTRSSTWLKRQLLDFDANSLSSLSLTHSDGSQQNFQNHDSLWVMDAISKGGKTIHSGAEVDKGVLSSIRSTVAKFRISSIAADSLVAKVDLEKPEVVLDFQPASGAAQQIKWYRPDPESRNVLCRVRGYEDWFETYKSNLDKLQKSPEEFLKTDN